VKNSSTSSGKINVLCGQTPTAFHHKKFGASIGDHNVFSKEGVHCALLFDDLYN